MLSRDIFLHLVARPKGPTQQCRKQRLQKLVRQALRNTPTRTKIRFCKITQQQPCYHSIHPGYSSVGRASDCRSLQQSDGPWFDSGWPDCRTAFRADVRWLGLRYLPRATHGMPNPTATGALRGELRSDLVDSDTGVCATASPPPPPASSYSSSSAAFSPSARSSPSVAPTALKGARAVHETTCH